MSQVPSAPPLYPPLPTDCEVGLANSSASHIRHWSVDFKRLVPNLRGGRLGDQVLKDQGNMFVNKLIKLKYGPEKAITFSISFIYNAPIFSLKIKATDGAKLLDENGVMFQLSYTSASGKRTGGILEDLDNESLKSEEGYVAVRTNTPESKFRAIFFKGNKFFQPRKEVIYTVKFWLRMEPILRSSLHSKKFQKLNEMLFLNKDSSGDLKINCQGKLFNCHKLVISCQSDAFCKMLNNSGIRMLHVKNGEVKIDDVKPEVMETLIYFIYHDAIQDETKINSELLLAADRYKILGLMYVSAVYLEANLSLENGLDVMISAYITNQKSLFAVASKFVCKNKCGLIKSDFWNEMLTSKPELIGKAFDEAMLWGSVR